MQTPAFLMHVPLEIFLEIFSYLWLQGKTSLLMYAISQIESAI